SAWHGSRPPEQPGRANEQDRRRDQVEDGELYFGEELDARCTHKADDQRADERALDTTKAADHDHDESQNERIDSQAEHRRLSRNDNSSAQPCHEAADGECLYVDATDIEAESGRHAPVLRCGPQYDAEARSVDEPPQSECGQ